MRELCGADRARVAGNLTCRGMPDAGAAESELGIVGQGTSRSRCVELLCSGGGQTADWKGMLNQMFPFDAVEVLSQTEEVHVMDVGCIECLEDPMRVCMTGNRIGSVLGPCPKEGQFG